MSAYWIAHVTVTDPDAYAGYQALAPLAFARFGAEFLARGGTSEVLEGPVYERHVIIRFPDLASAQACYRSDEYQRARQVRAGAATASVTIVDGMPGV
ncbi:DUF1330 domain-containing protein [Paracoccus nototheniae]|uniref:DUF1330 domain-containing protein n=1 Tax=Paracoccus nototheniae TaxID=2489002 RepID=A0ABW4E2W7_9RHOB|nr:DUF1330 domain-containing protein [Paracoccus nototheniae]